MFIFLYTLHPSSDVFVRKKYYTSNDLTHLLDEMIFQGSIPESIHVVQLLAKSLLQKVLSF